MSEIVAIVEGQTEQTFIGNQLKAHLGQWGVSIWAVRSGKSRRRGGVQKWESARNDITRILKEGRYCTTMFDFYAMPSDWPGRIEAADLPWDRRGDYVENAILKDLAQYIGEQFNPNQFIPYVQVHEFEALMFSDVKTLTEVCVPLCRPFPPNLHDNFIKILEQAGNPEAIDDGYETCPSRQITNVVKGYRKRVHSPIVAVRIGLDG